MKKLSPLGWLVAVVLLLCAAVPAVVLQANFFTSVNYKGTTASTARTYLGLGGSSTLDSNAFILSSSGKGTNTTLTNAANIGVTNLLLINDGTPNANSLMFTNGRWVAPGEPSGVFSAYYNPIHGGFGNGYEYQWTYNLMYLGPLTGGWTQYGLTTDLQDYWIMQANHPVGWTTDNNFAGNSAAFGFASAYATNSNPKGTVIWHLFSTNINASTGESILAITVPHDTNQSFNVVGPTAFSFTTNGTFNATNVNASTGYKVNGSFGSAGQVLTSTGTTSSWSNAATGGNTGIVTNGGTGINNVLSNLAVVGMTNTGNFLAFVSGFGPLISAQNNSVELSDPSGNAVYWTNNTWLPSTVGTANMGSTSLPWGRIFITNVVADSMIVTNNFTNSGIASITTANVGVETITNTLTVSNVAYQVGTGGSLTVTNIVTAGQYKGSTNGSSALTGSVTLDGSAATETAYILTGNATITVTNLAKTTTITVAILGDSSHTVSWVNVYWSPKSFTPVQTLSQYDLYTLHQDNFGNTIGSQQPNYK